MKGITGVFALAGLILGAGLMASPVLAKCSKQCKAAIGTEFKGCKKACTDEKKSDLAACKAATDPTPPLCGEAPTTTTITTTTTTTTITTTTTLPVVCGAAPPAQCQGGNDPCTGAPWTVCAADQSTAWVSHNVSGGGSYHPLLICESLGYSGVVDWGGTNNNICSYTTTGTSCSNHGEETFDNVNSFGDLGADGCGQIIGNTVMWLCGTTGTCSSPTVIPASGGEFFGRTQGTSWQASSGCRPSETGQAPEWVFQWTPTNSGTATIQTCGAATDFDTVLYLRSGNCNTGTEVACNDDTGGCGSGFQSTITPAVTAGTTYFIIVDGYATSGNFTLSVTSP